MRLLLIGLGGGVGSILRYLLAGLVQTGQGGSAFPAGTLAVNLLGCLGIGVLAELSEARGFLDADTRAMIVVGLIGGFTTFSTFANETVSAMRDGALLVAVGNVVLSVGLGLVAVWLGRLLAHAVWG
ncbi:MAG: fluoride efflux transporter CrcB [Gemmatimonadales bacterium]|nr:fluoride efflux transporter CrcB [Gemmatimonadales bacterium]